MPNVRLSPTKFHQAQGSQRLPRLRQSTSFDDLFDLINALIRPIPKIGELAVYDTAVRIGARFGLEPRKVFLHTGTRDGARALGFDGDPPSIQMAELPAPIQRLTAGEAEDLLCIYKNTFGERHTLQLPH